MTCVAVCGYNTWRQGGGSSHRRLEGEAVLGILKHVSSHLQLEHEVSERIARCNGSGLEGVPRERSQQTQNRRAHRLLHLLRLHRICIAFIRMVDHVVQRTKGYGREGMDDVVGGVH